MLRGSELHGIWLLGAVLDGQLDLEGAKLRNAEGYALNADGAVVKGGVFLTSNAEAGAFEADGEVRLLGAAVDGQFNLRGAKLRNAEGYALSADGVVVKGDVFLSSDAEAGAFEADGEVRLLGAAIDGQLNLRGAKLRNTEGYALSADGVVVKGDVFFTSDAEAGAFKADGEVRLPGAAIDGQLNLRGAKLRNAERDALNAEGVVVKGSVILNDGFQAKGTIGLLGAEIGGHLRCDRSTLRASKPGDPESDAIDLSDATIGGGFYLFGAYRPAKKGTQAKIEGRVNLRRASIRTLHDFHESEAWESLQEAPPIALDGCQYNAIGRHSPTDARFRKAWLALGKAAGGGFAPQPYTQLAKTLREMGHPEDAKRVLIEREKRQLSEGGLPKLIEWVRRLFVGYLLGHGYRPWRAGLPLLLLFVVGAIVFGQAWTDQSFVPSESRVYMTSSGEKGSGDWRRFPPPYTELTDDGNLPQYPKFNAWVYSLDTLLPIVDLHLENYWLPTGGYRKYLWCHIAMGWVFTTIFVAGLAGVVRRPAE